MRPRVVVAAIVLVVACVIVVQAWRSTSVAVSPPASSSDTNAPFSLVVTANHARYAAGDPIDVSATVEYTGPMASIDVPHDSLGLAAFGIDEPVDGMNVHGISDLMCAHTVLQRGSPVTVAFRKTGSSLEPPPDPSAAAAFFSDPVLRLPAGTWHIYAEADFPLHACGGVGQEYHLRAQITIDVEP
jgi:hypothetical protein